MTASVRTYHRSGTSSKRRLNVQKRTTAETPIIKPWNKTEHVQTFIKNALRRKPSTTPHEAATDYVHELYGPFNLTDDVFDISVVNYAKLFGSIWSTVKNKMPEFRTKDGDNALATAFKKGSADYDKQMERSKQVRLARVILNLFGADADRITQLPQEWKDRVAKDQRFCDVYSEDQVIDALLKYTPRSKTTT